MSVLSIQISEIARESGEVHVRIENPDMAMGATSILPFDEEVALPAVLKALEATRFCRNDFTDEELAWLRKERFIVDSPKSIDFSGRRMQKAIGKKLFDCLLPNEKMRGVYAQFRRSSKVVY